MEIKFEFQSQQVLSFIERYRLSRKLNYGILSSIIFSLQTSNKDLINLTSFFLNKIQEKDKEDINKIEKKWCDNSKYQNFRNRMIEVIEYKKEMKDIKPTSRGTGDLIPSYFAELARLAIEKTTFDQKTKILSFQKTDTISEKIDLLFAIFIRTYPLYDLYDGKPKGNTSPDLFDQWQSRFKERTEALYQTELLQDILNIHKQRIDTLVNTLGLKQI